VFYGWKIVAALFIVLMVTSGLGFYNQSVMMEALTNQSGFSVESASTGVSIFFLASGILGPPLGAIIERVDVRGVIVAGAVIAAASLAWLGRATTIVELYSVQLAFGVGFCASGLLPATTLIARWFEARRAAALSLASTGLSVGGIVVTPASAALIESVGFQAATVYLGLVYLVGVAPLTLFFVRSSPASMGLAPDGEVMAQGEEPPSESGAAFGDAIRGFYFWGLGITWVFIMLAQVGGIAHQYGIVRERIGDGDAPLALAVLPLFSIIGRLTGGYAIDRGMSTRVFTMGMIALQGVALLVMSIAGGYFGLLVGLALFGITVGNLLMLQPLLIAEAYGPMHYARLFSVNNVLTMIGVAIGPWVMGVVLAGWGGYAPAYLLAAAASGVALLVYLGSRPPAVGRTAAASA